jgi:hypothetical protein
MCTHPAKATGRSVGLCAVADRKPFDDSEVAAGRAREGPTRSDTGAPYCQCFFDEWTRANDCEQLLTLISMSRYAISAPH